MKTTSDIQNANNKNLNTKFGKVWLLNEYVGYYKKVLRVTSDFQFMLDEHFAQKQNKTHMQSEFEIPASIFSAIQNACPKYDMLNWPKLRSLSW